MSAARAASGLAMYYEDDYGEYQQADSLDRGTVAETGSLRCVGMSKLQYRYSYQDSQSFIVAYSDSDWAGDRESRRSTLASADTRGGQLLESTSATGLTIAHSSGEAEFCALQRAAAGGLQSKHGLEAFGRSEYELECRTDATTSKRSSYGCKRKCGPERCDYASDRVKMILATS